MLPGKFDHPGQCRQFKPGEDPQPQHSRSISGRRSRVIDFFQHAPASFQEHEARIGKHHATRPSFEELHAQLFFKLEQLPAQ
ncbi:MAG: hypothetical protein BGP17_08895 [Sphingomonas sp. 67-41]|nr:MAG: hypothetical protein BGP17_08895 [Sphingomonas sp. 67-41]